MNAVNWTNCAMWVQDIASPGTNIMAEISKQDANYFKQFCQKFSIHAPKFNEVTTLSTIKTIAEEKPSQGGILDLVEKKIVHMWSLLESRQRVEANIISTITKYINSFDASLCIVRVGSSQYGIRGSKANVNLLINTRKFVTYLKYFQNLESVNIKFKYQHFTEDRKPKESSQLFFFKLDKTDILNHFKEIFKLNANRVLRRQINMIHINSGLQCTLLFDRDNIIAESTEIIKHYVDKEPMCKDHFPWIIENIFIISKYYHLQAVF